MAPRKNIEMGISNNTVYIEKALYRKFISKVYHTIKLIETSLYRNRFTSKRVYIKSVIYRTVLFIVVVIMVLLIVHLPIFGCIWWHF